MRLVELIELCNDSTGLVSRLQEWGLIPTEPNYKCGKCGGVLKLSRLSRALDGWRWQCYNTVTKGKKRAKCGNRVSFRTGTFFERSKLTIFQILGFVRLWVLKASLYLIGEELNLKAETLVNWSSFCREVVEWDFMTNKAVLGGEGKVVEIDEAVFGKGKSSGGKPVSRQSVFGAFERCSGRVLFAPVEDLSAASLLEVITERIAPDTTVLSDCWKAYNCMEHAGYKELKVNRRLNFKDAETNTDTNCIRSTLRPVKSVTLLCGRKKAHVGGNLAKYMFLKGCKERKMDPFMEFLGLVRRLYDATRKEEDDGGVPLVRESLVHVEEEMDLEEDEA